MRSRTASGGGIDHGVHHPAVGQENNPIGVAGGHRVMGNHHDRLTVFPHRSLEELEQTGAGGRIEVTGRLVGEDDVGSGHHGPGRRHPLLLASRQLDGTVAEPV